MVKHLNIRVYGKVQRVFFRSSSAAAAINLGINGLSRNEQDGSVYIEAEGDEEALKKFVDWCYVGPPRAEVERIVTEEGEMKKYSNFVAQR